MVTKVSRREALSRLAPFLDRAPARRVVDAIGVADTFAVARVKGLGSSWVEEVEPNDDRTGPLPGSYGGQLEDTDDADGGTITFAANDGVVTCDGSSM